MSILFIETLNADLIREVTYLWRPKFLINTQPSAKKFLNNFFLSFKICIYCIAVIDWSIDRFKWRKVRWTSSLTTILKITDHSSEFVSATFFSALFLLPHLLSPLHYFIFFYKPCCLSALYFRYSYWWRFSVLHT